MALVFERGSDSRSGGGGWSIEETTYDPERSAKIESIFALGNGYMGLRAATEERYAHETRGFYLAGLFDAFPGEVTELANLPDWLTLELWLDGERFSCATGTIRSFNRTLDLRSGLLVRSVEWESPGGRRFRLLFERFLSLADLHAGAVRASIEPLDAGGTVRVCSGIDGQVTNSGVQHLRDGQLRVLPDGAIALLSRTQESGIEVCITAAHRFELDGETLAPEERVKIERRRILLESAVAVERGSRLTIAKYVCVHTDRDHGRRKDDERDRDAFDPRTQADPVSGQAIQEPGTGKPPASQGGGGSESPLIGRAREQLQSAVAMGFDRLFAAHRAEWNALWGHVDVELDGPAFDQLAIRFALFHLLQMTPRHDPRSSVAAKGLTGEGYKGHVFWDTEIFVLPLFTFTMPDVAERLLEYRYRMLDGARRKSRENGYRGAMYPWESADTGDETTPPFWGVDALTGRPIAILSGSLEQHISVEVPYAVWLYYQVTGDERFLLDSGLEIMLETARFWASRVEWKEERGRYEITDVMGPDEYGEHVSNNAYTNHMVAWHLRTTVALYEELSVKHPRSVSVLAEKIAVSAGETADWLMKASKLFTNVDAVTGFICQYDGFTEKQPIDIAPYRGRVGSITAAFGWEDLMRLQVIKQADTVMLLYLRGEDFSSAARHLNWDYYEPKTLHDSSLSAAIHSIVASDMGDREKAYDYFGRAVRIDLGDEPSGSHDGVHAAALGGVWQAAVNGFAGVRATGEGYLRISPQLPGSWERLAFSLVWRGRRLEVVVTRRRVVVRVRESMGKFDIECAGVRYIHPGSGTLEIGLE